MLMRAATAVQVLQDLTSFTACFILLVIAPLQSLTHRPRFVAATSTQFATKLLKFSLCRLCLLSLFLDITLQLPFLCRYSSHLFLTLFHLPLQRLQTTPSLLSLYSHNTMPPTIVPEYVFYVVLKIQKRDFTFF